MSRTISTLCDRIKALETSVDHLSNIILTLTNGELKEDRAMKIVQPTQKNILYSEAVKTSASPPLRNNLPTQLTRRSVNGKTNSKVFYSPAAKEKNAACDAERADDVMLSMTSSQKKTEGISGTRTGSEKDTPGIAILHDSVLNGVQARRLGLSYGLRVIKRKCQSVSDIETATKSATKACQNLDAIVLHCGINTLRHKTPQTASSDFVAAVNKIQSEHPKVKVVVSKISPVKDPTLHAKSDLFNALVCAEFVDNKNISVISHENLHLRGLQDQLHPNQQGASVLARNLGRHLHSLFWTRPKRRFKPYPQQQVGFFDWRGVWHPYW